MNQWLKDNAADWIYRIILLSAVCFSLWLNQNYVRLEVYSQDKKETATALQAITSAVTGIEKSIALLQQQQLTIADHEMRLRTLERKP